MNAPGQGSAIEEDNQVLAGPGSLLRAARESASVSLRDISAQLHLDERTVDSLERDDFANLPAPTFVRGYLRGYARLLSVPVGPVLEAYDREGFRPPDLVADISEEPDNNASDFPVSLVTWAVVLILLAMVVVWWNNNNPEFGDLIGPVATDPVSSTDAASDSAFSSAEPVGDDIRSGELSSPGAIDGSLQSTDAPTADLTPSSGLTAESDTTASVPPGALERSESSADATSRAEEVLAQAQEVLAQSRQAIEASPDLNANNATAQGASQGTAPASQPSAAESAPGDPSSGEAQTIRSDSAATMGNDASTSPAQRAVSSSGEIHLVLKFAAEAWVQITDREEKKLYYNLAKAGQTIDLLGQAPLRVILGRTQGVEVLVNEQPFDVTPHISKGVARFSLP